MGYSGAGGKLTDEKTRSKKSCDTVPLILSHLACFAYSRKNGRSFCYPTLLVNNNCLMCMETPEADFMMYNFIEVSASSIQCLHYKPVSNHFCSGGGGGGLNPLLEVTVNTKEENL